MSSDPTAPPSGPQKRGPKRKKNAVLSPLDRMRRLADVEAMLVAGLTATQIMVTLAERWSKEPGAEPIKHTGVGPYITAVRQRWADESKAGRSSRRNEMRERYNLVYQRAMNQKITVRVGGQLIEKSKPDYHAAVSALRELCRLDGLNAAEKVQVEVKSMSIKDALEEIAETNELLALAKERNVIDDPGEEEPVH